MKKVSIILICHNHQNYVQQAIESVLGQDYPSIELIVADDGSTDDTVLLIESLPGSGMKFKFIRNPSNLGYCKTFNRAFKQSTGDYIIDLAADDYFFPGKVSKQVNKFSELPADYGVVSSDASMVDDSGMEIETHVEKVKRIGKLKEIPEGDVFSSLLQYFCISAPTQMIRRQVLEELGGYDEELYYEDFDFWIRSSRSWKYAFIPEKLMAIRKLSTGMSAKMYGPKSQMPASTFKVVEKASQMIRDKKEKKALLNRLKYEMRMAYKHKDKAMLNRWHYFYQKNGGRSLAYKVMTLLS